tara:strand:- start:610 stop:858 length:249 start_codon:yes stop_codon:yes gene_type:complete
MPFNQEVVKQITKINEWDDKIKLNGTPWLDLFYFAQQKGNLYDDPIEGSTWTQAFDDTTEYIKQLEILKNLVEAAINTSNTC